MLTSETSLIHHNGNYFLICAANKIFARDYVVANFPQCSTLSCTPIHNNLFIITPTKIYLHGSVKTKPSSEPATSRCTMEEKASRYYYYLYIERDKRCQFPGKKLISRAAAAAAEFVLVAISEYIISTLNERKKESVGLQESKQTGIECGPSTAAAATENVYVLF